MITLLPVGAYDAKTRLPDLLRRVGGGVGFLITQRGEPVAELVPIGTMARRQGTRAASRMRHLMQCPVSLDGISVQQLRHEDCT